MKLVVISPEAADPRELAAVRSMLGRGLTRYHLRKPGWTDEQLATWCEGLSANERQRVVLHGEESVARRLGLGGAHGRGDPRSAKDCVESGRGDRKASESPPFLRSRSCHHPAEVRAAFNHYDAVFLSPVFPSLSKPGHGQTREWTDAEVHELLTSRDLGTNRTEVIALGGIQKGTTERCRELGFDGAAAHGAIWQATDPVAAFIELRDGFSAFAGRPLLAGSKSSVSNFC